MKITFICDPHFSSINLSCRKDFFPDAIFEATKYVLDASKKLGVDFVAFGGDFTHSTRLSIPYINKLLELFSLYDFEYGCVTGNHEVPYGDYRQVYKSPLGVFFSARVFTPAPFEWHIRRDNCLLVFMPYMISLPDLKELPDLDKDEVRILFAHCFLPGKNKQDLLPLSYTKSFDYIFLGHDHDEYPPERVNRALVIRPGALSRGTRAASNWDRDEQFAFLDTEKGEVMYCKVPCKPASEIFSKERMDFENRIRESRIIDELSTTLTLEGGDEVSTILESLNMNPAVKERVVWWLRTHGMS